MFGFGRTRHREKTHALGYHPEWERKELPGYGSAQQFAYETYALKPSVHRGYTVPIATAVYQPPQIEHMQMVRLDGYGTSAGTMALPTLFDPSANLASLGKS